MLKSSSLTKIILQTLLFNCIAVVFVTLLNSTSGWNKALSPRSLSFAVIYSFSIGTFCGFTIHLIAPRLQNWSKSLRFAVLISALFFAVYFGLTLGNSILYMIGFVNFENILPLSWQILTFPLAIGLIFGGGAYFYESSQVNLLRAKERLRQKEIDEANAQRIATEAQLASLESRIHPHFLFNTLNSIAALIREEPILAEKTVEKLSALLRYSLDSNAKSLVSLKQELEITEKYLEIEKIRFDKRLNYKIECEPQSLKTNLPPLALQTLVENSIKHVVSKTSERSEIVVSIAEANEVVEIKVCDNGKGFSEKDLQENHGLDILRKRLQTIFGNAAALQIADKAEVKMILPK